MAYNGLHAHPRTCKHMRNHSIWHDVYVGSAVVAVAYARVLVWFDYDYMSVVHARTGIGTSIPQHVPMEPHQCTNNIGWTTVRKIDVCVWSGRARAFTTAVGATPCICRSHTCGKSTPTCARSIREELALVKTQMTSSVRIICWLKLQLGINVSFKARWPNG